MIAAAPSARQCGFPAIVSSRRGNSHASGPIRAQAGAFQLTPFARNGRSALKMRSPLSPVADRTSSRAPSVREKVTVVHRWGRRLGMSAAWRRPCFGCHIRDIRHQLPVSDDKDTKSYRSHHSSMNAKIFLEKFRRIGAPRPTRDVDREVDDRCGSKCLLLRDFLDEPPRQRSNFGCGASPATALGSPQEEFGWNGDRAGSAVGAVRRTVDDRHEDRRVMGAGSLDCLALDRPRTRCVPSARSRRSTRQ